MSKTYTEVYDDTLSRISGNILKNEGSLVANVASAEAYEIEALYNQVDYVLAQMDPETADYDYLVILAKQRGITPDDATAATVKIKADAALPIGTRFSLASYNYAVTAELDAEAYTYTAVCEQTGSGPNGLTGTLTPISYVEGLESAEITEVLIAGTDADDRAALYRKYRNSFNNNAFAGNAAAYKNYFEDYDGIGGCKVHPVWNGAGTVKCVLIGSDYGAVTEYLLAKAKAAAENDVVPIGAELTVESVAESAITVTLSIAYSAGYSWETCAESIDEAIDGYLETVRRSWSELNESETPMVYLSKLQAAILDVEGILDIRSTLINGKSESLALAADEIPILGDVEEA